MVERSKDWLNQAERDIKQAEASIRDGFYKWACFAAQQASGKSVKALIQVLGGDVWGHSVTALIDALPEGVRPYHLRDEALELDQAYIPSKPSCLLLGRSIELVLVYEFRHSRGSTTHRHPRFVLFYHEKEEHQDSPFFLKSGGGTRSPSSRRFNFSCDRVHPET